MNAKDKIRLRIAQAAARIIVEEGVADYLLAKQKAAGRVGVAATRNLPRNEEIDTALEEYHRLYRADKQREHITRLRKLALEAMDFLRAFSPRLVGGVLEGSAGDFSPITLHLFPDSPEDVIRTLMDHGIPFSEKPASVPTDSGRTPAYSALCFVVDGVEIQSVLLPMELKQQRLSRKERHLPRGDTKTVAALIRQAETPPPGLD